MRSDGSRPVLCRLHSRHERYSMHPPAPKAENQILKHLGPALAAWLSFGEKEV
jgi:hypothetical protein